MLHAYSLDTPLPGSDDLLLQRGKTVHDALAKGPPKTPAKKGRKIHFQDLASELHDHLGALTRALKDVKREEREAEQALSKRDAAVASFEQVYSGIAAITACLLELSGNKDLGDRVKPTVRRRTGLDTPADPTAPADPPGTAPVTPPAGG